MLDTIWFVGAQLLGKKKKFFFVGDFSEPLCLHLSEPELTGKCL